VRRPPATRPTATKPPARRPGVWWVVGGGLLLALLLAFAVSPFASAEPDGLERVAIDRDFDDTATEHAAAGSPLADYTVRGVGGDVSTSMAGVAGVAVTFAVASGGLLLIRRSRRERPATPHTTR
jgi:cobalt/nickel transport system permease protein